MRGQGKTVSFAQRIVELINNGDENIMIGSQGKIFEVAVIVRCKDCKYKGDSFECHLDSDLEEHGGHRTEDYDDWFCADGVKRDG